MQVVKLGGSLYGTAELEQWLQTLSAGSRDNITVVVPGGGPFADQVRDTQHRYPVGDSAAHHMAILAMAQFGLMLLDLADEAQPFYYPGDSAAPDSGLHVWLPDKALLDVEDLPHSWDITSDSLALWLTQQLEADEMALVKRVRTESTSIRQLSESSIVDDGFLEKYQLHPVPIRLFHDRQYNGFPDQGRLLT